MWRLIWQAIGSQDSINFAYREDGAELHPFTELNHFISRD